jgi:hypothetical protein
MGISLWDPTWTGLQGRTYFVQSSSALQQWRYLSLLELGQGTSLSLRVTPSTPPFLSAAVYRRADD